MKKRKKVKSKFTICKNAIKKAKKKTLFIFMILIIMYFLLIGFYNYNKPLQEGVDFKGKDYYLDENDIMFLYDLTYIDSSKKRVSNQMIFDKVFHHIENANNYILIDMFLFNSLGSEGLDIYRNLSYELREALIEKKTSNPDIQIDFITDEINNVYGGSYSKDIKLMKNSGINVIVTDLGALRDSNLFYSPFYRGFISWFGNSDNGGIMPNPFSKTANGVSIRTYFRLFNFKSNHRKSFVADYNDELVSIVMSANPHEGSSAHSNVGIFIKGDIARDIYETEKGIAKFSGKNLSGEEIFNIGKSPQKLDSKIKATIVTEKEIKRSILSGLNETKEGDSVNIGIFYISDRDVIKYIIEAVNRGVDVRIIMDPNKDAFGHEKPGIPNRQVAKELIEKTNGKIRFRWYDTHGEQFHSKIIFIKKKNGECIIIVGSANYTKRNLDNMNLEMNVKIVADSLTNIVKDVEDYFDTIWNNKNAKNYTIDYSKYEDNSLIKVIIYRFQEWSGISTF